MWCGRWGRWHEDHQPVVISCWLLRLNWLLLHLREWTRQVFQCEHVRCFFLTGYAAIFVIVFFQMNLNILSKSSPVYLVVHFLDPSLHFFPCNINSSRKKCFEIHQTHQFCVWDWWHSVKQCFWGSVAELWKDMWKSTR